MNVTELARRLKITPNQLRDVMPLIGFDIGVRAIKIDAKMAQDIMEKLSDPKIREEYLGEKSKSHAMKNIFVDKTVKEAKERQIIEIPERIMVKELARRMRISVISLIMELMKNGVMASINQDIDFETAVIISEDMGFTIHKSEEDVDEASEISSKDFLKELKSKDSEARPPVVVVMGHVDHGKTKLLDAIREEDVAMGEAGGITQHIGAYQIEKNGRLLTFIDTPGHEAFSAMRSRGAQVADIAILVVAADDGIQPQTVEAISHIRNANLPFIVAINKIDKPGVNIDKTKSELSNIGLTPEDWGGETICVEISAKEKINISGLLDTLFLVADLRKEEIIADKKGKTAGTIIESHIDKGEGPVSTVLIQNGFLSKGDFVKVGECQGKIRSLKDWQGNEVEVAMPSMPVRILGLKAVPKVGQILQVIKDKQLIRQFVRMKSREKQKVFGKKARTKEERQEDESGVKKPSVKIILKTDVLGSGEALIESFEKIERVEAEIKIIKQGLGNITEKDIAEADSVGAILLGFNVKFLPDAKKMAVLRNVEVFVFNVIYDLVELVKKRLNEIIGKRTIQVLIGKLRVIEIFRRGKKLQIVGGEVVSGKIMSNSLCRLLRSDEIIGEVKVVEVEAGREKVNEVALGQQCGVKVEGNIEILKKDLLEFYKEEIE